MLLEVSVPFTRSLQIFPDHEQVYLVWLSSNRRRTSQLSPFRSIPPLIRFSPLSSAFRIWWRTIDSDASLALIVFRCSFIGRRDEQAILGL